MGQIRWHRRKSLGILVVVCFICFFYIMFRDTRLDIKDRTIIRPSGVACKQPDLQTNVDTLARFYYKYDPLTCNNEEIWVDVQGSTAVIKEEAIKKHGSIECVFKELVRIDDDTVIVGKSTSSRDRFTFVGSDFYKTECKAEDKTLWNSVLAGIRKDEDILVDRQWDKLPTEALGLNVLMLAFDSLSRNNFIRTLPKTYSFLANSMQASVLEGYNIVGDGTPQALIPILTGKTEIEMPDTRRRSGDVAQPVDVLPLVWNDFRNAGYVTLFAEDQPDIGTFNYRLKGFTDPPTDHYMRTFYNHIHSTYRAHPNLCLRGTPRHKIFLDYFKNFFNVYSENPKFAFGIHAELSHDDYNLVAVADDDLLDFLQHMKSGGHLENTIVVLFSDHGHRYSAGVRTTQEGKQEERLPFVSIYLPPRFKQAHPSAADNIKVNAGRLTTPFDLYPTLKDVLKFSGAKMGSVANRAISLFSQIPASRTCFDAYIEAHWCACLTWETILPTEEIVIEAAEALVHYINSYTATQKAYCHILELDVVHWAGLLLPNQGLMNFKKTMDMDGFLPDLSDRTALNTEVYQIGLSVKPDKEYFRTPNGLPTFEASLTYNIKQDSFSVKMADVSRTNRYGDQAHCILTKDSEIPVRKVY